MSPNMFWHLEGGVRRGLCPPPARLPMRLLHPCHRQSEAHAAGRGGCRARPAAAPAAAEAEQGRSAAAEITRVRPQRRRPHLTGRAGRRHAASHRRTRTGRGGVRTRPAATGDRTRPSEGEEDTRPTAAEQDGQPRVTADQGRPWRNEDGRQRSHAASRRARFWPLRGIARGRPREKKARSRPRHMRTAGRRGGRTRLVATRQGRTAVGGILQDAEGENGRVGTRTYGRRAASVAVVATASVAMAVMAAAAAARGHGAREGQDGRRARGTREARTPSLRGRWQHQGELPRCEPSRRPPARRPAPAVFGPPQGASRCPSPRTRTSSSRRSFCHCVNSHQV